MKKKHLVVLAVVAALAVPSTLALASTNPSPNTNSSVSSGSAPKESPKSSGLNTNNAGFQTTRSGQVKNDGKNGTNGVAVYSSTTSSSAAQSVNTRFSSDQEIKDNNNYSLAEKVYEINSGIALYRVTGNPDVVGYSPLMPAQQLISTNDAGEKLHSNVTVNISVAALGNAQNIQLYYYNAETKQWQLAPVNAVDYATKTINVTMPGNAIFTIVHKN